jgi:hypothetical protein
VDDPGIYLDAAIPRDLRLRGCRIACRLVVEVLAEEPDQLVQIRPKRLGPNRDRVEPGQGLEVVGQPRGGRRLGAIDKNRDDAHLALQSFRDLDANEVAGLAKPGLQDVEPPRADHGEQDPA